MEVTLYTRQNCPLCDKAKAVLRGAGLNPKEVDVDLDLDLIRRFGNDVPVIYVDGVEAFRHRVTPEQIEAFRLSQETCVPCRGGVPALKGKDLASLRSALGAEWHVVDEHHLEREFRFKNFAEALEFTNKVGALAEEQKHHPDIYLAWGKVRVTIWTHKIDGLTRSDFVLATKIDRLVAPAESA